MFLLDTNIVSSIVRDPQGLAGRRIDQLGDDQLATSIVVTAELHFGLAKRPSARLTNQLNVILERLRILPLGTGVDRAYARIRTHLERRGTPIGGNDLFIAAHALSLGATLVTDNVGEFARVPDLMVENWLQR